MPCRSEQALLLRLSVSEPVLACTALLWKPPLRLQLCSLAARCTICLAALPMQVLLEEGGRQIPVTIRGLSPNGYLLVRVCLGSGRSC